MSRRTVSLMIAIASSSYSYLMWIHMEGLVGRLRHVLLVVLRSHET